ncbi:TlpA family protein disulfide reductase [Pedobacter sp. WC2501]|uniref:TlpA family protein disulfide reductase n=1 Tax=Pedobacter sp. WC2501 TaxID=3461400 RepID=UPI004045A4C8
MFSLLFLLLCKQSVSKIVDVPKLAFGKAKLIGRLRVPDGVNIDSAFVKITVSHPISGEFVKYKALVDRSGNFSIDADVETAVSYIHFSTSLNPGKPLFIKLKCAANTHLDIAYNSDLDIENITVEPSMDQNDMTRYYGLIRKMIEYSPTRKREPLYDKGTGDFLEYARSLLSEILTVVKNDTLISKELKSMLNNDFRLFFYKGAVFDYDKAMMANYSITNGGKEKKLVIKEVDRSYYRFLKELKLNDPQYLYTSTFLEFQKQILLNKTLAVPQIGETDISNWLSKTKIILSDLVGFRDGLYYDILAANAYGRQLTEELRPLSEIQKKNILKYWGNKEIAKILFRKNKEVVELDKFKSPAVINDASQIAEDRIIESIVSKHKGKVILIDLWATWCGPCLEAMQRFRTTKNEFHDKNVVFVYLTNSSSPRNLWEEKVKGIGNQHYYLNDAQWTYVMTFFGFQAIPSYLLFNKEGVLVKKITAFPENEYVKKMIDEQLDRPNN